MSDDQSSSQQHLTPEETAFAELSSLFKLVQSSISELGTNMREAQTAIAQHFQTAVMKELHIFRTVERQIRSNTITTELMQEALTALNILRADSMKEMTVIMENAISKIKEGLSNGVDAPSST